MYYKSACNGIKDNDFHESSIKPYLSSLYIFLVWIKPGLSPCNGMIQSMSVYERLMWKFAWDSGLQLPFPWHNTRYGFTVKPRLVVMDDSTNSDKTLRLRFHGPGSVLSLLTKSDSADLAGWESCHDRNDGWLRRHPRIFRVFKILLKKKKPAI